MKAEAQNIAIAQACGWKWYRWGKGGGLHLLTPHHDWTGGSMVPSERVGDEEFRSDSMPDYLNDLNAMHEAENGLSDEDYTKFHFFLVSSRNDECMPRCRCPSANAAQRAEAFLKAIGKWEL